MGVIGAGYARREKYFLCRMVGAVEVVKIYLKYSELAKPGKNGWKRYLLSIVFIIFFWLLIGSLTVVVIDIAVRNITGISHLINFIQLNSSFVVLLAAIYLSVRYIHKRKFKTLITPYDKVNWKNMFYGFGLYFFLTFICTIIEYFVHPGDFTFTFNAGKFIASLPVILIFTPIQTTTEELFFRGYIIQSFGLITGNNVILSVISGVLFVLPHLFNPEMSNGFLIMILYYFVIGLLLASVTLKSNTLEVAIGAHTANNLFSALLVNYENSVLETNSVFTITNMYPLFSLIEYTVMAVVFYFLIARFSRRSCDV